MFRAVAILAVLSFALPNLAQSTSQQAAEPAQSGCASGSCGDGDQSASAPPPPSVPYKKWQTEDFHASDASVTCAVVKYDSTVIRPVLHLLCPGPEIFAPLRVHLTLTWRDGDEIPAVMRSMGLDISRPVKFKSKPGNSKAELTFQDAQTTRSIKQWISFTQVNVGLVLPPK